LWERKLFTRIDAGEPISDICFDQIARSFLTWAEKQSRSTDDTGEALYNPLAYVREKTCIERYLIPFFGGIDLRKIKVKTIEDFVCWRNNYYIDGPGAKEDTISFKRNGITCLRPSKRNSRPAPSTVNKDAVAYSKVLKHARKTENLAISDIPKIEVPKDRKKNIRRRTRFSDCAWTLLQENVFERVMSCPNERVKFLRFVLWGLITLLRGTGIRVSEASWLQIKHLKLVPVKDECRSTFEPVMSDYETWDQDTLSIDILRNGYNEMLEFRVAVDKNNPGLKQATHARSVIPTLEFSFAWFHYLRFLAHNMKKSGLCPTEDWRDLSSEQYLFTNQDGQRIKSLRGGFSSLLNASKSDDFPDGLRIIDGERMSLSCIRHTYASKQIEAGAAKSGLGLLADNMGTSPEMIRRHYGQELRELRADDLQLD
jgi:hypothetical protein